MRRVLRVAATLGLDVARALKSERLSQGEARKLVLAHALLSPFDYLLLDEPTNHVDIALQHQLQGALLRFEGGLVLVCHDEEFMWPCEAGEIRVSR
jgi:ATPase subunit of ABC transporter with duplicated ATPase domains